MKRIPLGLAIVALVVSGLLYAQLNNPPRGMAEEAGRKLAEMERNPGDADRLRVEAAEHVDQMLAWKRIRLQVMFPLLGLGLALLALQPALARAARAGLVKRGLLTVALALLVVGPVLYGRALETPPGWAVEAAKSINEVRAAMASYDALKAEHLRSAQERRDDERHQQQEDQKEISMVLIVAAVLLYAVFWFLTRQRSAAAPSPAAG